MDIAVSAEDQIAISCDAKRCIWKHAEAIGQGRMGQGELAKGFVVIYFCLSKKWSGHNINVTLTPETQIARDETVVQTIDVRYFLRRGGKVGGIVFVRFSVWLRKIEGR